MARNLLAGKKVLQTDRQKDRHLEIIIGFPDQSLASAYHYMVADWIAKDPETLWEQKTTK